MKVTQTKKIPINKRTQSGFSLLLVSLMKLKLKVGGWNEYSSITVSSIITWHKFQRAWVCHHYDMISITSHITANLLI